MFYSRGKTVGGMGKDFLSFVIDTPSCGSWGKPTLFIHTSIHIDTPLLICETLTYQHIHTPYYCCY
jgi:hypothetical protein